MEMEREVKRLRSDLHEAIETRDFYNVSIAIKEIETAVPFHIYLFCLYILKGAVGREQCVVRKNVNGEWPKRYPYGMIVCLLSLLLLLLFNLLGRTLV